MSYDFWDVLIFTTHMGIRKYYQKADMQKTTPESFCRKCGEEIAGISSAMFDVISAVAAGACPNYIPDEIAQSGGMLPAYGFMKVLQAQGGVPSPEQIKLLEAFFHTAKVGFTEADFLAAVFDDNKTRQAIEDLACISDSKAGWFWQIFFKAMFKTNSDEKTLPKVAEHFSSIVARFSILGRPDSRVALPVCETFIKAIHTQIVECRRFPGDIAGTSEEIPLAEHYRRMKKICMDLAYAAGDQDNLDMEQLFSYYSIGILYQLIKKTTRCASVQAAMLDRAMKLSKIKAGFVGVDAISQMTKGGELADLINGSDRYPQ